MSVSVESGNRRGRRPALHHASCPVKVSVIMVVIGVYICITRLGEGEEDDDTADCGLRMFVRLILPVDSDRYNG